MNSGFGSAQIFQLQRDRVALFPPRTITLGSYTPNSDPYNWDFVSEIEIPLDHNTLISLKSRSVKFPYFWWVEGQVILLVFNDHYGAELVRVS